MSLSVERLKELENIEKYLAGFWADSSPLQIAALDCIKAIKELIAIKEAEPVAWLVHAEREFVDRQPQIIGGLPRTPLIRKPE